MFLSFHVNFSFAGATVVSVILDRISGLESSLDMLDHRYLKLFIASRLFLTGARIAPVS